METTAERKRRRERERFEWAYGSPERVSWVSRQACENCGGRSVPCHNAHLKTSDQDKRGGTGMKGHHTTIGPLCPWCHDIEDGRAKGTKLADPDAVAARTEERWQAYRVS